MSEFKTIVGMAIGEASMCWSEIPQGIFESERASDICDRILAAHAAEIQALTESLKYCMQNKTKAIELNKILRETLENTIRAQYFQMGKEYLADAAVKLAISQANQEGE